MAKKVLCSMVAERKLVSNSQSLCNIHWIYTAWYPQVHCTLGVTMASVY